MNEIITCPHCQKSFPIDEAGIEAIRRQVRNKEFDKELEKQLAQQLQLISEKNEKEAELKLSSAVAKKDEEIAQLNIKLEQINSDLKQRNTEFDIAIKEAVSAKENEIVRLNEQINSIKESGTLNTKNEVEKIANQKNEEIAGLKLTIQKLENEVSNSENRAELALSKAVSEEKSKYEDELKNKDKDIILLNSRLEQIKLENQIALKEAVSEIEKERDDLKNDYEIQLRLKQDELEQYKTHTAKLSTKMLGETLEKHCENAFNMIRTTAFRNAEFGKDNDVTEGTKGDYIYRERDDDGNEIISIMFEMKNEMDATASKHKNEDFFAKLDKDRKNKKCEYAILVSALEKESELYNQGIVDVSYEFEKMYVIRPQFFIPIISILRNAAMNSMEYKRQLTDIKNQEIDITNFEERIEEFKSAFSKNYDLAGRQFNTAIEEIDKTIEHLTKVKDNLQKSLNNLRLANNKAQTQLTIKALTKGNETMIEMFSSLEENEESE